MNIKQKWEAVGHLFLFAFKICPKRLQVKSQNETDLVCIINLMQAKKEETIKKLYQTSLRCSYFNHMQGNKFMQKSKLQIEEAVKDEVVDENTFRIIHNFVKPDKDYAVYKMKAMFYIEEEGFFSCISSRKKYDVEIINYKLWVTFRENLKYFFNFETEEADIQRRGDHFTLRIRNCEETQKKDLIVDDWVNLLNKIIQSSDGKRFTISYLPQTYPKFYTQQHISNEEFEKAADSCDIILFKSEHSAARIQRIFTDSEYDHVGIVLRNKKNELFIFESTSNEGVGITPWKHMIKYQWYKSTDKITWRRLNIKLSSIEVGIIQAFVAKTLGKGFDINMEKIFMQTSALKRSPQQEQKKTYFCSELAARLYKELSLFNEERASSRYYPVDFSEKVKLKFKREDVNLDPQRVISFHKK